jgi:ferrous-iron efflux pump FieF
MDVFASSVNLFAVRVGGRPADDDHRYGHGKAESLAGMFQGAVVGFSGVYLIVESVKRLVEGGRPEHEALGLATMAVAMLASIWITWLLRRTAKAPGSLALAADSLHYASDVWRTGGVFVAVALVAWTGQTWLDPVTGLLVAFLVLKSSWSVLRASLDELMDRDLGPDVERLVREAVARDVPQARAVHALRTRRAGRLRFVDLTVGFDRALSLEQAHTFSERVKAAVSAAVPGTEVEVHADPYPLRPDDHPA